MAQLLTADATPENATLSAPVPPLGQWLIAQGWIDPSQLEKALRIQRQSRTRLGTILTHRFQLAPRQLACALAAMQRRPLLGALEAAGHESLLRPELAVEYERYGVAPQRWDAATGRLRVIAPEISLGGELWLGEQWPGATIDWLLCTPRDLRMALAGPHLARRAAERVWSVAPRMSARHRAMPKAAWCLLAVAAALAILWQPAAVLWSSWALWQGMALLALLFKAVLAWRGWHHEPHVTRLPGWHAQPWKTVPAAALPVYSILVPLLREARMVPHLLARLEALHYPREKLDIKCLVEADDEETLAALKAARPEGCIEILRVPPGEPRTKPKACNYALPYLRGALVAIYDAEDAPEPDQLRKSAWAFAQLPARVACLQASLNFYNPHQSLLTRWFTLEYGLWFGLLLRGLERDRLPIPLGGTSNHLRRAALEQVGGWDAYNVTEDADLGIRLERFGWQTHLLPSHTWEEAPARILDWLPQRRRWIKGYLQTWCVHLRMPWREVRQLGWRHALGFHLFIGAPCFLHLGMPFMLGIFLLSFLRAQLLPQALAAFGIATFLFGTLLHFALGALIAHRLAHSHPHARHAPERLVTAASLFPVYWLLHSVAAFQACWQLLHAPYRWDKSPHGHSLAPAPPAPRRWRRDKNTAGQARLPLPGLPAGRKGLTAPHAAFIEASLHPRPGGIAVGPDTRKDPHHESAQLAEIRQEA